MDLAARSALHALFVCFSETLGVGVIVIGNVIIHEFVNLSQTHTRAYREKCHTHTHDATGAYATGAYEVRLIRNGDCSPGIPKSYHWGSLRSSNHKIPQKRNMCIIMVLNL